MSRKLVFDAIYARNGWGTEGDGSGGGSEVTFTEHLRDMLMQIIAENNIKSMLDAPCGSCKWTSVMLQQLTSVVPDFHYHGIDVSDIPLSRAAVNTRGIPNVTFSHADICSDPLPTGFNMVLCRDTIQHLSYRSAMEALKNIANTGAQWVVLGGYVFGTNESVEDGGSYPFNPCKAPFNLKPTTMLFEKRNPTAQATEKTLFVFDGNDLRQQIAI